MMGGSSGSKVCVDGVRAFKRGGDVERLRQQYDWLASMRGRRHVVNVTDWVGDGYVMERLVPLPHDVLYGRATLCNLLDALEADVWCDPPEVEMDWDRHNAYRDRLVTTHVYHLRRYITRMAHGVREREGDMRRCRTHGDPTIENVMLDLSGGMRLIDPIPARPAVPDLLAVDLGKIAQSCCGYERQRWGTTNWVHLPAEEIYERYPEADTSSIAYFLVFHLLRLLAYMPTLGLQNAMRWRLIEPMIEMTS